MRSSSSMGDSGPIDKLLAIGTVFPMEIESKETVSPNSFPSLGVTSTLQLWSLEIQELGISVRSSI